MKKYKIILVLFISFLLFVVSKGANAYGFGVKKNTEHKQPDIGIYKGILDSVGGIYVGDKDKKNIYLTFDCGYENGYTEKILDVLEEKNVNATFFLTGHYIDSAKDLVLRMKDDGHILANHSNLHKNITTLNRGQIEEEIKGLEIKYNNLTGSNLTKFFRPPAGNFDQKSLEVVKDLGYVPLFWSVAYKDWDHKNGIEFAVQEVCKNIHNGAIILLHAVSSDNAQALSSIIDKLQAEGYIFTSTKELLNR
jgi:peptidoglycan-N-acetylmuramic acid deacetylase